MNVPLPHASFPAGDSIPFTVQLLTDEQGSPWGTPLGGVGFPAARLGGECIGPALDKHTLSFAPVQGRPASYSALLQTAEYDRWGYRLRTLRRGLYRYTIWLSRAETNGYPPQPAVTYTLLKGTFTLT